MIDCNLQIILSGFRIQSVKLMMQVVDVWKKFSHPNCVTLREVFTTKAFGDNSLILVYDLHAGSQTLLSKYFTPITNGYGTTGSAFSGDARPFSHKSTLQRTGETNSHLSFAFLLFMFHNYF